MQAHGCEYIRGSICINRGVCLFLYVRVFSALCTYTCLLFLFLFLILFSLSYYSPLCYLLFPFLTHFSPTSPLFSHSLPFLWILSHANDYTSKHYWMHIYIMFSFDRRFLTFLVIYLFDQENYDDTKSTLKNNVFYEEWKVFVFFFF